jgi:hypothetical protein
VHVEATETGAHGAARLDEASIIGTLKELGMSVLFKAIDGDRDVDKEHAAAFEFYRDMSDSLLEDIVRRL